MRNERCELPRAHDTQSVNNNLHLRRYLNIVARQKQHRHQSTNGNRETTVACPRGHGHWHWVGVGGAGVGRTMLTMMRS